MDKFNFLNKDVVINTADRCFRGVLIRETSNCFWIDEDNLGPMKIYKNGTILIALTKNAFPSVKPLDTPVALDSWLKEKKAKEITENFMKTKTLNKMSLAFGVILAVASSVSAIVYMAL